MIEDTEGESNLTAPSRVHRIIGWLKRPRTVRFLAPGGLLLGVALAAIGVMLLPGGGAGPVSGPDGGPDGVTAQPGTSYRVPAQVPGTAQVVEGTSYLVPQEEVSAGFRLVIDALDVNAPVIQMGLDLDNVPEVPYSAAKVAWYDFSSKPGSGSNAVMAGHVRWAGDHGVFAELDELQEGDFIQMKWQDGNVSVYEVIDNLVVDTGDPNSLQVMEPTPRDTITLITCGGTFVADASDPLGGEFTNRYVVQARLIEPSVAALSR